jgi:hypothetical protein
MRTLRTLQELMTALVEGVEPVFTVDETAVVLDVSRHTAYAGVGTGEIDSIKILRSIKVPTAWLRETLGVESAFRPALNEAATRRVDLPVKISAQLAPVTSKKPVRGSARQPSKRQRAETREPEPV